MSNSFIKPVADPITQAFGAGKELSWQFGHGHLGTDFGCQIGTEVKTVAAGRILWSNWGYHLADRSWEARWFLVPANAGICVVVDHGSHISIYGHLNECYFEPGDWIEGGTVIGKSGTTGLSTGPHLHLEMVPKPTNYQDGLYGRRDPIAIIAAHALQQPVPTPTVPAVSNTMVGIDISNYQAGLEVSATGAQFAIVKASEGVGWADPQLASNIASVRRAGVPAGFYHFSRFYASSGNTPEAEAQSFLDIIRPHLQDGDLVVLDLEKDNQDPANAKRFLDIVSNATSRKCLLYINKSTAEQGGWDEVKGQYPLWLAYYPTRAAVSWSPVANLPSLPGWNIAMWQHADTGQIGGWNGNLDVNVFYGDKQAWADLAGGRGFTPAVVPQTSVASAPAVRSDYLIVEAGDSFSGIAAAWGFDLQAFKNANPGLNYDRIFPGDLLQVPSGTAAPRTVAGTDNWCTVDPGDTFSGIAIQYGIDLEVFKSLNPGLNYDRIFPGQKLNLPTGNTAETECIVDPGDTLTSIANQFGVSVQQIINLNPDKLSDPNYLQVGWVLRLR